MQDARCKTKQINVRRSVGWIVNNVCQKSTRYVGPVRSFISSRHKPCGRTQMTADETCTDNQDLQQRPCLLVPVWQLRLLRGCPLRSWTLPWHLGGLGGLWVVVGWSWSVIRAARMGGLPGFVPSCLRAFVRLAHTLTSVSSRSLPAR